jgi:tetratricopeptide (TPR) repeat protein
VTRRLSFLLALFLAIWGVAFIRVVRQPETIKTFEPNCPAQWGKLAAVELAHPLKREAVDELLTAGAKCQRMTTPMAILLQTMQNACEGWKREPSPEGTDQCRRAIVQFQSELTEWQTRTVSIEDITNKRVLAQKIIARFRNGSEEAAKSAERLLQLDPLNKAAAKAAILSHFVVAYKNRREPSSEGAWNQYSRAVQRLRDLGGDEEYFLSETGIVASFFNGNLQGLDDKIRKFQQKFPTRGQPFFFGGLQKAQQGKRREAIALLKKAVSNEPNNINYSQSLKRLNSTTDGDSLADAFGISFSYNLSELLP